MKKYKYLMIHCSATPEGRDVQPADIVRMHTAKPPAGRGWKTVGYRRFITLDGVAHILHEYNNDEWIEGREITNGAAGWNGNTAHICYAGGMSADMKAAKDTRTDCQSETLEAYVKQQLQLFPDLVVLGHNQVAAKACPSFNVPQWLRTIGVAEKNIYK